MYISHVSGRGGPFFHAICRMSGSKEQTVCKKRSNKVNVNSSKQFSGKVQTHRRRMKPRRLGSRFDHRRQATNCMRANRSRRIGPRTASTSSPSMTSTRVPQLTSHVDATHLRTPHPLQTSRL